MELALLLLIVLVLLVCGAVTAIKWLFIIAVLLAAVAIFRAFLR